MDFSAALEDGSDLGDEKMSPQKAKERLEAAFRFLEEAWGNGQELSFFLTHLTTGNESARFIAQYGSESYSRFGEKLLIFDRKEKLRNEILRNG